MKLKQKVAELGIPAYIGVTSGQALCGLIGSSGTRREYTVLGDVVNLSARLMQKAMSSAKEKAAAVGGPPQGLILCDRDTRSTADKDPRLEFEELPTITVKGKQQAVEIFHPSYVEFRRDSYEPPQNEYTVGRESITEQLCELVPNGLNPAAVVMLLGEVGVGKTHVLADVSYDLAASKRADSIWGVADPFNNQ